MFYNNGYHQYDDCSAAEYHDYYARNLSPAAKSSEARSAIRKTVEEMKIESAQSQSKHDFSDENDNEDDVDLIFSERTSHDSPLSRRNFKVATKLIFDSEEA
jgi:transposase-like protein